MQVPLTVSDFIDRAAFVYPERTALVDEPGVPGGFGETSYGELASRAAGMAAHLDDLGVPAGGRVAIVSPNAGRFLVSFFGVSGYGRALVPVNFRLNAAEVGYIVEHSGAEVLLVDPEYDDLLRDVKATHRILLDGKEDAELFAPLGAGRAPKGWRPDENATCSVNYTSGTTARPKGVELTHRNCTLNAMSFGWHTAVSDRDVLLHTLPMFHCNGWGMPYAVTAMGGKHVVLRKVDGEDILKRVEDHGITLMCGAPAVVAAILAASEARTAAGIAIPGGTADSHRVRIVVAGAPPPSRVIERVETELGWEFIQIYGLTETAPLLTINRAPLEWDGLELAEKARRLSRAGVPALGVKMDVDEEGEVLARSNHVFAGYWQQEEESAKVLVDGWFHTGDGGHFDGAYVVISDRKKDVIITGGENVSSIEVEDALYGHPGVLEAAVIGVPDEKWGETVKALVVLRPEASVSEQELIDFCRSRLAHFKCPTSIEVRSELPRTATGKLQKFRLREPYWEGKSRQVN
jgi:fatty-acyl-CoA synthase